MPIWIAALVLLMVGALVFSHYAHRRVRQGDWRFAHMVFLPRVVIYGIVTAVGIWVSLEQPIAGIALTLFALVMVIFWLRAGRAMARAVRSGMTPEQLAGEMLDRAVEPIALYGILVLVLGFAAVIGLIVFGVADRL